MKKLAILLSLIYLPTAQAIDALTEAAEDDLIASVETRFKTHKSSLTELANFMLNQDRINTVVINEHGEIEISYKKTANETPQAPEQADVKSLHRWLSRPGLIGIEKKENTIRIPVDSAQANGNTLSSNLIYQTKLENLNWDCQMKNGRKNFRNCAHHLEGNWYLQYSWSHIPNNTRLKVGKIESGN